MLKTRPDSCSPRYMGAMCPWPSAGPAALDTSSDRTAPPRSSEASNPTDPAHPRHTPFRRVGNSFKCYASVGVLTNCRPRPVSRLIQGPLSTWSIASQGQADSSALSQRPNDPARLL